MSRFREDMSDLSLPATTYTTMLQQDPRLKEACRSKIAETREEYRNWRLQQAEIPPQAPPVSYTMAFSPETRPPPTSTPYTMAYLPETRPAPTPVPVPVPVPAPEPAPAPYTVTYVPAPTQAPRVAAPSPIPLSGHNHQYTTSQIAPQRTQEQIQAEREYVECSRQWKEALDILSTAEIQMRAAEARMAALGVVPDAHALLHQMSSTNHG
ncbi:uncharacterized protein LW93_3185 [Fusarium fujikuroi]|nr:uncharacterized protein LW93_3185 [Fusarium fujikuroi]